MKASLCHAHGNTEVKHSLSTNKKLSTMNVLCCQMRQTTKDAVNYTTWSSPCYASHSILDAGLQICLQCVQRLKDKREEEDKEQKETIMFMESWKIEKT